jgi:hypothetical protein
MLMALPRHSTTEEGTLLLAVDRGKSDESGCAIDVTSECLKRTWWLAGHFVETLLERGPVAGVFACASHDPLGCWHRAAAC